MAKRAIMIAETQPGATQRVRQSLETNGYSVHSVVAVGPKAAAKAEELAADVVLMDVTPGRDALDAIEAADDIQKRLRIPVILILSSTDEAALRRVRAIRPAAALVRPFGEIQILMAVDQAIARNLLERETDDIRESFAAVLRSISDAVLIVDNENRVSFMNPMAEKLCGVTRVESGGKPIAEVLRIMEEGEQKPSADPLDLILRKTAASKTRSERVVLKSADGTHVPIEASAVAIQDRRGRSAGAVVVFRDITIRKMMEQRILGEQKVTAIGKLAGTLAYDMSNILAVISAHAVAALETVLPGSSVYEDLSRIDEATRHAIELTRRVLSLARSGRHSAEARVQPTPLAELISAAVALVEKPFAEKNIRFSISSNRSLPWVLADNTQFLDVLVDLFLDAADAMPGGGTIRITVRTRTVKPPASDVTGAAKPKRFAVLRICDPGRSVSREMQKRLAKPVDIGESLASGEDLGLSLIAGSMRRCGGWITAARNPRGGACFTLYIPTAPGMPAQRASSRPVPRQGAGVLVVDDDNAVLEQIREILQKEHFDLHLALGGKAGLAAYRRHRKDLDLAIVDAIMPGVSGHDVIQAIMKYDPAFPLVVMSGFSRDYVRTLLPAGNWNYVQKPLEKQQLLSVIRRALSPSPG